MEAYSSDQEQIDEIKKWLRDNGMAIVVGIAVGFGGLYGWKEWKDYVNNRAEQASTLYSQIIFNMDNAQTGSVQQATDELIKDYSATPYAALAALAAAKVAIVDDNRDKAKERLQWVIDNTNQPQLVPLAKLRLARMYLVDKNIDGASKLLEGVTYPDAYAARVAELQGDLYGLRGETALARNAYNLALSAALPVRNQEMVKIKLDELEPVAGPESSAQEPASAASSEGAVQ